MPWPLVDFYTFVKDIRPFGNGSPVSLRYDPNWTSSSYAIATAGDIYAGEWVAWDATNRRVVRFATDGGNGNMIGVSRDSAQGMKKLGNQPALALDRLSVFTSGVHEMLGTSGDTYSHGDAVYMPGTDTQSITKTRPTVSGGGQGVQTGTVWLPDGTQKAGAVRVPVLIDHNTNTTYGS